MLELENLSAGYGQAPPVLSGVSLRVRDGQITALMGRNGTGKTTLCRAILGLVRLRGGAARLDGEDLGRLPTHRIARRGIAYVPQGREIFTRLTVDENLRLASRSGTDAAAAWRWFPALLPLRRRPAGRLSGGEQQMLAIARALVSAPRLLILDEPSEGLQPSAITGLAATLGAIAAQTGLAFLLVEQNLDLVRRVATTCAFLQDGRIAAEVAAGSLSAASPEVHRYLAL